MKQREIEKAIEAEVENWPGAAVAFVMGGKHPKAKLSFDGKLLSRVFPGTPSDANGIHNTLADIRRTLKQLGAERAKPAPSREEDEAPYRKPNDGAAKRPDPVAGEKPKPKATVGDQLVVAGVVGETVPIEPGSITLDGKPLPDRVTSTGTARYASSGGEVYDLQTGEVVTEDDPEAALAAIRAAIDAIEDGVYFDLPDVVYHGVPRLSSSGLQRLCVSPATFWQGSWLDPEKAELDEESTKAQTLGKAYHCARLEPDSFHERFVREISKDDFPAKGFLSSDAAVKAALKDLGEQQTITGETIEERCERLVDAGYEGSILPLEKARWEKVRGSRTPIGGKQFDQIIVDMERIRETGEIAELLTGGFAEVSIFWTDPNCLKMKARLDYLTVSFWTDLKTFANPNGKVLEQAIADFVRYNRVHVQAANYRDATEAVRIGGLDVKGEASEAQKQLVYDLRTRARPLACFYVFTEKGGVPNILAREFVFYDVSAYTQTEINALVEAERKSEVREAMGRKTGLYLRALADTNQAKREFVLYSQVYEPGRPWFPIEPRAKFSDLDFNNYWLEGKA